MSEVKMPSHIRIGKVNKILEEINLWMEAYEKVIARYEKDQAQAQYSEGVYEGLLQAKEIIERNIYGE